MAKENKTKQKKSILANPDEETMVTYLGIRSGTELVPRRR